MTLAERGLAPLTISLRILLMGERAEVRGDSTFRLGDCVEEIVSSGFPALRQLPTSAREAALDGYLQGIQLPPRPRRRMTQSSTHPPRSSPTSPQRT
jgi:hypothetical protein